MLFVGPSQAGPWSTRQLHVPHSFACPRLSGVHAPVRFIFSRPHVCLLVQSMVAACRSLFWLKRSSFGSSSSGQGHFPSHRRCRCGCRCWRPPAFLRIPRPVSRRSRRCRAFLFLGPRALAPVAGFHLVDAWIVGGGFEFELSFHAQLFPPRVRRLVRPFLPVHQSRCRPFSAHVP